MADQSNPRRSGAASRKPLAANAATPDSGGWHRITGSLLVYRGARHDSGQAWLLTFTDLSALMLTFFVLLFSMSSIDDRQWQNLIDALSSRQTGLQEVTLALPTSDQALDEVGEGEHHLAQAAVLKEQIAANEALTGARVRQDADRLVVSMPGDLLFASGAVAMGATGKQAVFALAGVLRNLRNVIEVAGHADPNQPGRSYPSNWELRTDRWRALPRSPACLRNWVTRGASWCAATAIPVMLSSRPS